MATFSAEGVLGSVSIGDFHTEAGGLITDVTIVYQRWGELQVAANGTTNIVLVEHALTGDSNAADWWGSLIGPGKALDTDRWCVVCTNVLGGCNGSTGPASPHPEDGQAWGSRFPAVSIRDQVNAEHRFLRELDIGHVHAVVGGSMGEIGRASCRERV